MYLKGGTDNDVDGLVADVFLVSRDISEVLEQTRISYVNSLSQNLGLSVGHSKSVLSSTNTDNVERGVDDRELSKIHYFDLSFHQR